jgi:hypothetical protein
MSEIVSVINRRFSYQCSIVITDEKCKQVLKLAFWLPKF